MPPAELVDAAANAFAGICGGGKEGRSWGVVSLGNVMVEFTLNSGNSPGTFIRTMLLVAGRVERTSSLLPPMFRLSSEFWYLL